MSITPDNPVEGGEEQRQARIAQSDALTPAGAVRTLQFPIGPDELRYWNAAAEDFVIDATTYDLFAGGDCTAQLTTTFTTA